MSIRSGWGRRVHRSEPECARGAQLLGKKEGGGEGGGGRR